MCFTKWWTTPIEGGPPPYTTTGLGGSRARTCRQRPSLSKQPTFAHESPISRLQTLRGHPSRPRHHYFSLVQAAIAFLPPFLTGQICESSFLSVPKQRAPPLSHPAPKKAKKLSAGFSLDCGAVVRGFRTFLPLRQRIPAGNIVRFPSPFLWMTGFFS